MSPQSLFLGEPLQKATVTLTDAQIKALPSNVTGIELIPELGGDKLIKLVGGVYRANFAGGAYTNMSVGNAYLALSWFKAGAIVFDTSYLIVNSSEENLLTAMFGGALDLLFHITPLAYYDADYKLIGSQSFPPNAIGAGLSVSAFNDAGDFTGGNAANSLKISVAYMILNTVTGEFE